jgi:hypothetical protein
MRLVTHLPISFSSRHRTEHNNSMASLDGWRGTVATIPDIAARSLPRVVDEDEVRAV